MPFIDCKLAKKIDENTKENIKSELGKAISVMRKSENYLMVGICDGYGLWFGGNRLENGAFVDIRVFGNVNSAEAEKMTSSVCKILEKNAGIAGADVYVTFQGIKDWGWNGGNF